jgi:lambda repressor-like predicted transcriptional regulator
MPLEQPKRDNPLMRRYFQEIDIPSAQLARRCGVSHSQMYMARKRNVGPDNAEKISRGVAGILGLPEEDRLYLKAEIMGCPGELVRAYLGGVQKAARLLDVPESTASEIIDEGKSVTHKSGVRALEKLRQMRAPEYVITSVDRRLMPPPEPRRGLITHNQYGPELAERRKRTKDGLRAGKPNVHAAIQASGLMLKEIASRAGVGKETMRRALYRENVSARSARAIAGVLREASKLSEADTRTLEDELRSLPQKVSEEVTKDGPSGA